MNKQAIENKHLQTQVGTVDSSIKAIDSVDKAQKAENIKLQNENEAEDAAHKALSKAEEAETNKEITN